jgi:DNA polymerase-3 subunit delta
MVRPLQSALERHGHGGVFYLHGDDEFRKEEAARFLVEAHLDPATAAFNHDRMSGSELDVEDLASVVATPPMMAEWRVVVVRETEALASSSRARKVLLDAAESPPPGLALILVCTVPDGSKARFYKDLASRARDLAFRAVSPNDVPGWLVTRAKDVHGLEMTEEAARALGSAVGADLGVLARELEKLADFVGDGATVDRDAVEAAGTRLPRQDRWHWFDLVGERRFDEAVRTLATLLGQQGESGVGLVIGLATHLLRVGVVADRGVGALEGALPSHQKWLARKMGPTLSRQARAWTPRELEAALEGLLRVDRLLKSSGLGDQSLIEEWLLTERVRADERGRGAAA